MTRQATILLQDPSLFLPGTPGEAQLFQKSRCGGLQALYVILSKTHLLDTVQKTP